MKEYRFTTSASTDVLIETERSDEYYFGMYVTIENLGIHHRWFSIHQLHGASLVLYNAEQGEELRVEIPEPVLTDLKQDCKEACSSTGRIIVATLRCGKEIRRVRYGYAIANVYFKGAVNYRMPENMEVAIRWHSRDKRIYCSPMQSKSTDVDVPVASDGNRRTYWFSHFTPNDPCLDLVDGTDSEGITETYELTLEVVIPDKE